MSITLSTLLNIENFKCPMIGIFQIHYDLSMQYCIVIQSALSSYRSWYNLQPYIRKLIHIIKIMRTNIKMFTGFVSG